MFARTTLSLMLLLAFAGTALAAHPLITDDAGTQGMGKYSLEINAALSRDKENLGGVSTREDGAEAAASLSAGIGDSVDIVVASPWVWSRVREDGAVTSEENGIGDLSLQLKWRFFDREGLSLAVKPVITLPTGDENRGLGNGKTSYGIGLILTRQFEPFALHVNGAYTRNEFRLDADKKINRSDIWNASVAAAGQVSKSLQLVADLGVESNGYRGSHTSPAYILGGAIYSLREDLDLDFGVKRGLNGPEADMTWLAGVTLRF